MEWGNVDVGDVHRNLGDAVFVDVPPDCLGCLECAWRHKRIPISILEWLAGECASLSLRTAFLAHVESDSVGAAGGGGVEVEVDGDKEIACANNGATCAGNIVVEGTCSEVGCSVGRGKFVSQRFVFACTAHGQILAFGTQGCSFVAIRGDAQFFGDAACQGASQGSTLFEGDACYGNKGKHVGCTHAWMGTVMMTHVDEAAGKCDSAKGCFTDGFGSSNKGNNCAIGGFSRIYVE